MGSSNPVTWVGDTLSSAADTLGNAAGDVLSGAGDIASSAIDTITSNPLETAAVIAAIAAGQPEFLGLDAAGADAAAAAAADTFGSSTAADIAANEAAAAAAAGAAGAGGITDIPINAFDGPTLPTDLPFDGPTLPTDVPYDGPTPTSATSGIDQPFDGPTLKNPSLWDKFTGGIQNLVNSTTVSNVFDSLAKAAPLAGAGILGKLAYADQTRINDSIVKAYNDYLSQQGGIRSGYGVTAGPQLLNYTRNATPLAQAPLRTVADVVNIPKKADGGSMNDLYNEYAMINNRMRNYKKLAKGGLI